MDAISTHAKRAAKQEQDRRYSKNDLERKVGASVDDAYLICKPDEKNFVMLVTDIGHYKDTNIGHNEWRRPQSMDEDTFHNGIYIEAEFYHIDAFLGEGVMKTDDTPFETPRLPRAAMTAFPRKFLDKKRKPHHYAEPL